LQSGYGGSQPQAKPTADLELLMNDMPPMVPKFINFMSSTGDGDLSSVV
jgi:hypothetical protein